MKWLCSVSIFFITAAAAAAEAPGFLQDPLPSRYKLRAHWRGGEASATKDGPTIVSTPPCVVLDTMVSVLEPARTGRVWILHTDDRLTIALWVDHEALGTVATKACPLSRESTSIYGNDLMFAARAIPARTFVYDAPNGSPIGLLRGWIPVVVQQTRDGWSEVTLGGEIPSRVWVRDEQIAHLR